MTITVLLLVLLRVCAPYSIEAPLLAVRPVVVAPPVGQRRYLATGLKPGAVTVGRPGKCQNHASVCDPHIKNTVEGRLRCVWLHLGGSNDLNPSGQVTSTPKGKV